LFFVSNNSASDLFSWFQIGDNVYYAFSTSSGTVLGSGTATVQTAVGAEHLVPRWSVGIAQIHAINTGVTARDLTVHFDSTPSGALAQLQAGLLAGSDQNQPLSIDLPIDASGDFYYAWSGAVTTGATIRVRGWRL
jgi:hypothetical protein